MGVSLKERLVLMPVTPGDLPERPEDLVAINLPKSIRTVWFLRTCLRSLSQSDFDPEEKR